jgi:hypothetical protein
VFQAVTATDTSIPPRDIFCSRSVPSWQNLCCAACGNDTFILRGFGPARFQMNGMWGEANPAVHKAADVGQPVTQEIAVSVKNDGVECSINGTVVANYAKPAAAAA